MRRGNEGAAAALAVLHVVIGDGRTGIARLCPAYGQTRQRRGRYRGPVGALRRFVVVVGHVNRHCDGRSPTLLVLGLDGHRIAIFHLVVVIRVGTGLKLGGAWIDRELIRIPACKAVGQCGVLGIGRAYRAADVLPTGRVLGQAARRCGFVEYRPLIGAGGAAARGRPGARAFVVGGPHLHLVAGIDVEAGDRRGGAVAVVQPGEEAAAARPILDVVAVDAGSGVGRLGPGHGEAGGRGRLNPRGRRPPGRFVDVGHVDGDGDDVGAVVVGVVGFQRQLVAVGDLVVVGDAGAGAQLPAAGDDGEAGLVGAWEAVGEAVSVRVAGADRVLDVLVRSGVLGHGAGGMQTLVKGRGLIVGRRGRRRRGEAGAGAGGFLLLRGRCSLPRCCCRRRRHRWSRTEAWGAVWARR